MFGRFRQNFLQIIYGSKEFKMSKIKFVIISKKVKEFYKYLQIYSILQKFLKIFYRFKLQLLIFLLHCF